VLQLRKCFIRVQNTDNLDRAVYNILLRVNKEIRGTNAINIAHILNQNRQKGVVYSTWLSIAETVYIKPQVSQTQSSDVDH
jgi:hypothetical protein